MLAMFIPVFRQEQISKGKKTNEDMSGREHTRTKVLFNMCEKGEDFDHDTTKGRGTYWLEDWPCWDLDECFP